MPQSSTSAGIQRRPFGRHAEVQGSILALGGHHIGDAEDEPAAAAIINGAIDEQVEKLESFVEAMADGIIEKTELEKQQTSVVQAMKAVEGDLTKRRPARESHASAGGT